MEKAKKEYEDKLRVVEQGSGQDLMVNAKEEQTTWIIYTPANGVPKKYEMVTIQIPYEEYYRLTREAWKKAEGDKVLFSFLFQVEHMKRTWKKIGGVLVDEAFWHKADPAFVDTIREQMYGPCDLYASGDSELLKNLMPTLLQFLQNTVPGLKLPTQSTINSPLEEKPSEPMSLTQS